ncbi:MAG: hypothetical protein M1298_05870 [Chloroflexi bacterium]|nr:hypothetical protein [Chloroflexota bacterium]
MRSTGEWQRLPLRLGYLPAVLLGLLANCALFVAAPVSSQAAPLPATGNCLQWVATLRPDVSPALSGPPASWPLEAFQNGFAISNTPSPGAIAVIQPELDTPWLQGRAGYVIAVGSNGWFQLIDPGRNCAQRPRYVWQQAQWGVSFIP